MGIVVLLSTNSWLLEDLKKDGLELLPVAFTTKLLTSAMTTISLILLFLVCTSAAYCQSECQTRFTPNFHRANNRALQNHELETKITSSAVICGRDCSMEPQCASFNYFAANHYCQLNNITRAHGNCDFVVLRGGAYFDENPQTPALSAPNPEQYNSCQILLSNGYTESGVYTIFPDGISDGVQVYCDMQTDQGGWLVFQRRQDGSVDFYRNWADYQCGFGNLSGEFWLGNDILRNLTASGQWELRVDLWDWEGNAAWGKWGEFAITGENYRLSVGLYDGSSTSGDAMAYHNTHEFSTKDRDHDTDGINCAQNKEGAWWFANCFISHPNGKYYHDGTIAPTTHGISWKLWKGRDYSLKECNMKIRMVL